MGAPLLRIKIDVKKVAKAQLYEGKNGTYLDMALWENRDGADKYGNDGFITQELSKEAREAGEKGAILGNWKYLAKKQAAPARHAQRPAPPVNRPKPPADPDLDAQSDDIPF